MYVRNVSWITFIGYLQKQTIEYIIKISGNKEIKGIAKSNAYRSHVPEMEYLTFNNIQMEIQY